MAFRTTGVFLPPNFDRGAGLTLRGASGGGEKVLVKFCAEVVVPRAVCRALGLNTSASGKR